MKNSLRSVVALTKGHVKRIWPNAGRRLEMGAMTITPLTLLTPAYNAWGAAHCPMLIERPVRAWTHNAGT
ncbi:hypothetical protein C8233_16490 [Halomonas sp. SF2003]|nr:hypothetical protein C8233_16490 [Halomonas sp. SF2003]